jgi:hypothetical protein
MIGNQCIKVSRISESEACKHQGMALKGLKVTDLNQQNIGELGHTKSGNKQ